MTDGYYDREGKPLKDVLAWGKLFQDMDYKRVADTFLWNGLRVSTVWVGHDMNFGDGLPHIFETMVFTRPRMKKGPGGKKYENIGDSLYCDRYASEDMARIGHEKAVQEFRKKWWWFFIF